MGNVIPSYEIQPNKRDFKGVAQYIASVEYNKIVSRMHTLVLCTTEIKIKSN